MLHFTELLPLSLYIHIPWCIKKCPYCDFNSHRTGSIVPESLYIERLMADLENDLPRVWGRKLTSIFIGGGTPSLFSAAGIEAILAGVRARLPCHPGLEITLEANPGTFEQQKFCDYYQAGINRLSIGIQSFQAEKLKALGRVHNHEEAMQAVSMAKAAGFTNINLDLMHGLPHQSLDDALFDLNTAINFSPTHLSWYQLTLEPDTVFAKRPPVLSHDEALWDIQQAGQELLRLKGYQHYEISAYAKSNHYCAHNINYWAFGDYLGIGAGAHAKITDLAQQQVTRYVKTRNPSDYLNPEIDFISHQKAINAKEMPFEFMLNVLRLTEGVTADLFALRTGLALESIQPILQQLIAKGLLADDPRYLKTTALGQRFLNDCLEYFLV